MTHPSSYPSGFLRSNPLTVKLVALLGTIVLLLGLIGAAATNAYAQAIDGKFNVTASVDLKNSQLQKNSAVGI